MIDLLSKFWSWFKTITPLWLRALVALISAVIILIFSLSSCAQTVKVTVRDTPSGVTISTTQTKKDSAGTNISINPNINIPK